MNNLYKQTLMAEALKVLNAASAIVNDDKEDNQNQFLNAFGSLLATVDAATNAPEQAHIAAAQTYQADALLSDGPEGYNVKCKDHVWVPMDGPNIVGGEMCQTCLENKEPAIPIRAARKA